MSAGTHDAPVSRFPETRWTLVVSSRGSDTRSRRAMEELCRAYWYPLYAHARGRGCPAEDAEDLTQTFFSQLLARESMNNVDQEAGRLRSYFLTALNNLIARDWRHRSAKKRGGGEPVIHIDQAMAERRLQRELGHSDDPVRQFNRRWALTLLDAVMEQLRADYERQGQEGLFDALSPYAAGASDRGDLPRYRGAAEQLGISEGTFRVYLFRFRKRFRQLLRAEIMETVNDPSLVETEFAELFAAVARP